MGTEDRDRVWDGLCETTGEGVGDGIGDGLCDGVGDGTAEGVADVAAVEVGVEERVCCAVSDTERVADGDGDSATVVDIDAEADTEAGAVKVLWMVGVREGVWVGGPVRVTEVVVVMVAGGEAVGIGV